MHRIKFLIPFSLIVAFPCTAVYAQQSQAKGPVPVMMMFDFGFGALPGAPPSPNAKKWNFGPPPAGSDPPATEQLLAAGWGYAYLNAYSVQADKGAGLTKGIIVLTNKGRPRKPDDWGSLRAWG